MEEFTSLQDLETNLLSYVPELKTVMEKPAVENPFKSNLKFEMLDIMKMILLCVLIPLRLLLLGVTLLFAHIVGNVFLLGYTDSNPATPLQGVRRIGQDLIYVVCRICLFACGYHYVNIIGSISPETRVIVAAPHSSFIDTLVVTLICRVTAPTRAENLQHLFFGKILRILQLIPVSRADKNSRIETIKEIKRRVLSKDWYPTVIFPEGTCTNGMSYIYFKLGAFIPGLPVQPVILRYKDKLDYATWTWIGRGAPALTLIMMSQLYNTVEVKILPTYNPTKEEIDDPSLYACNVREYIAKIGGVPVTDHSFEDCRLMSEAQRLKLPMEVGLVEYYKLNKLIGINCDFMLEQLQKFFKIDQKCDGHIDLEEFCNYLNLPATEDVEIIFRIYDLHKSNGISFRDFLIGEFLIAKHFMSDENIRAILDLIRLDQDNGYSFTLTEFLQFMKQNMDINDELVRKIFIEMDVKGRGQVYYEEFKDFCTTKPEYVLLFMQFCHRRILNRRKKNELEISENKI